MSSDNGTRHVFRYPICCFHHSEFLLTTVIRCLSRIFCIFNSVPKKYFTLLVSFCICASLHAQYKGMFLELGGSGGLGSINYEHTLWDPASHQPVRDNCGGYPPIRHTFTWRAGISATPIDKNNGVVLIFPVMANMIYGLGTHKVEAGTGVALSITTKGSWYIKSPVMIGYRFEPPTSKLFFRVNYTPIFGWLVDVNWQHWAGISLGYRFE